MPFNEDHLRHALARAEKDERKFKGGTCRPHDLVFRALRNAQETERLLPPVSGPNQVRSIWPALTRTPEEGLENYLAAIAAGERPSVKTTASPAEISEMEAILLVFRQKVGEKMNERGWQIVMELARGRDGADVARQLGVSKQAVSQLKIARCQQFAAKLARYMPQTTAQNVQISEGVRP